MSDTHHVPVNMRLYIVTVQEITILRTVQNIPDISPLHYTAYINIPEDPGPFLYFYTQTRNTTLQETFRYFKVLFIMACILGRGITLIHPYSKNKSD